MIFRQRGQALPLGLAMLLVGVLGALVLYNTGRTATDKARLANAADAAAYSGLLWQARALNFQAYTNRAMVANQVSIAQGVSLSSWFDYGDTTADNIRRVLGGLPFVGPLAQGAAEAMNALDGIVQPVAKAMVSVLDKITRGLSVAQEAMFKASFAATPEIVDEVIRKSDADGRFTSLTAYSLGGLHANLTAWSGFTERHGPDSDTMGPRAKLIMDSRDKFTKQRDWKFFSGFWFYSTPFTRHRVFRSGTTRLIAVDDGAGGQRWEWQGRDSVSLHNRIRKWTGKEKKHELPIGWGASYANGGGASYLSDRCGPFDRSGHEQCGTWGKNAAAERRGLQSAESSSAYNGLKAFRTISAALLANDGRGATPTLAKDPLLRLKVEAAMSVDDARSSGDTVRGELLESDLDVAGDRLSSISIAEVYYRRPDERTSGGAKDTREAANGYNPYWDVRLAPIPDSERLLALGLRMGTSASAPDGGGGALAPDARWASGSGSPSAGAAGSLPGYVETFASAYPGADVGALGDDLERYAALDAGDLGGFVTGAEAQAGIVREQLEEQLKDAVRDILAGIGSAAIDRAGSRLDGLDVPSEADVRAAADEVEELSDRFRAVADIVTRDIGTYLEDLVQGRVAELAPEVGRIDEIAKRLESAAEGEIEALQAELAELLAMRDTALQWLRDEITAYVIEVVERHVPEYEMPVDLAWEAVEVILAEYRGELGPDALEGALDVIVDEEETDVDEHEGDDHGEADDYG